MSGSSGRRPAAPSDLGQRGRRLWREVVGEYALEHHERELLAEAARVLDTLDDLAAQVDRDGTTVAGSKGQPVLHPALGEARQQRLVLSRLLAQLDLPDDDGGQTTPSSASLKGRHAANVRWRGGAA